MSANPSFLPRLLDATGLGREELRKLLKLSRAEMETMEASPAHLLPGMTEDPFWSELADLVDFRLGKLMAIKFELDKKLMKDRQALAVRRAQMRNR